MPAVFYCMITNIDENFGIMEEKLAALGLTENCIVIFSAGNGSTGGTRVFNVGMSGGKGGKLEGGHRVPFIMRRAKGRLAGGKTSSTFAVFPHHPTTRSMVKACGRYSKARPFLSASTPS